MVEINVLGLHYRFSKNEINQLLGNIVILIDSREQQNDHIVQYFKDKGISYKTAKLDSGDYSIMLPACPELGIPRDIHFPVVIERKNSIDELAATFRERARFEHELVRAHKLKFLLLIEDSNGYKNLVSGQYRSQYNPRSLLGSWKAFESKFGFGTAFVDKQLAGHFVFHHLFYHARAFMKGN